MDFVVTTDKAVNDYKQIKIQIQFTQTAEEPRAEKCSNIMPKGY